MYALGIILFIVGIVISLALHEAGHMWSARAFGMKVTRYFIGFGPTIFAFKRKGRVRVHPDGTRSADEVEYGLKAIPAGAFVKIVGMTPQDDDVEPGEEARAMWRYPVWKRTIVLAAGSITHLILALVVIWSIFAFVPLPDYDKLQSQAVTVGSVQQCVATTWQYDATTNDQKACVPGTDPASAASLAGLQAGDVITGIDGQTLVGWDALTQRIRDSGGQSVTLDFERDGVAMTSTFTMPTAQRVKLDVDPNLPLDQVGPAQLEEVGVLGITAATPTTVVGPGGAFKLAGERSVDLVKATFSSLKQFPEKIPKLWTAITGGERDPDTPVSVVGATRIGGELLGDGQLAGFLGTLAVLNLFLGIFNLLPLLPLDGGHIAVAWFEKLRSWIYALFRRPDPGRVDYLKLMPITYVVILIFGGITLLTFAADIINPIRISR